MWTLRVIVELQFYFSFHFPHHIPNKTEGYIHPGGIAVSLIIVTEAFLLWPSDNMVEQLPKVRHYLCLKLQTEACFGWWFWSTFLCLEILPKDYVCDMWRSIFFSQVLAEFFWIRIFLNEPFILCKFLSSTLHTRSSFKKQFQPHSLVYLCRRKS